MPTQYVVFPAPGGPVTSCPNPMTTRRVAMNEREDSARTSRTTTSADESVGVNE